MQDKHLGKEQVADTITKKITERTARLGVIGLGYVGLPLAMEMAAAGFNVIGIDLDRNKIAMLKRGQSYILDVPENNLAEVTETGHFTPTSDFTALRNADMV